MTMLGSFIRAGHDVDPDQLEPDLPAQLQPTRHELDIGLVQWNVEAQVGVHPRLAFDVIVPIRLSVIDATFKDAQGNELDVQSIHHRDENIFGLGDMILAARLGLIRDSDVRGWTLDTRVGLTVPTGKTEDDPFELGADGQAHQHIFFGTGTVDPVVGFDTVYNFGRFGLLGWAQSRIPIVRNRRGYRGPRVFAAGAGVYSGFGLMRWRFLLQPEVYQETPARWGSQNAINSGRLNLLVGAGVFVQPKPNLALHFLLKVPYYSRQRGGQLVWPFVASVGFNYTFDLSRHDEHGH